MNPAHAVRVKALYAGEVRDAAELIAQLDYLLFTVARELYDYGAKHLDPKYAKLIADVDHVRGKPVGGMVGYPVYPRAPVLLVEAQQARSEGFIDQPEAPNRDEQAAWHEKYYAELREKQARVEEVLADAEREAAKPAKRKVRRAKR